MRRWPGDEPGGIRPKNGVGGSPSPKGFDDRCEMKPPELPTDGDSSRSVVGIRCIKAGLDALTEAESEVIHDLNGKSHAPLPN